MDWAKCDVMPDEAFLADVAEAIRKCKLRKTEENGECCETREERLRAESAGSSAAVLEPGEREEWTRGKEPAGEGGVGGSDAYVLRAGKPVKAMFERGCVALCETLARGFVKRISGCLWEHMCVARVCFWEHRACDI